MEDRIDDLESSVSTLTFDVMDVARKVDTLSSDFEEFRDEVGLDNLVECVHWILGRLKTIEKKLAIIPPARPKPETAGDEED